MPHDTAAAVAEQQTEAPSPLARILALLNIARDKRDVGDADALVIEREARERIERLIAASVLPEIGAAWPGVDGVYAGATTAPDGRVHALVRLNARPKKRLPWAQAAEWAKSLGAGLPDRAEGLLIHTNLEDERKSGWFWLATQYSDSGAWSQDFGYGLQLIGSKSYEGWAVAVRRFPLNPSVL